MRRISALKLKMAKQKIRKTDMHSYSEAPPPLPPPSPAGTILLPPGGTNPQLVTLHTSFPQYSNTKPSYTVHSLSL